MPDKSAFTTGFFALTTLGWFRVVRGVIFGTATVYFATLRMIPDFWIELFWTSDEV
jgi:hypothetical protein